MPDPLNLRENVPLADYTTLAIGGPARYFVNAVSEEQVIRALAFAGERGVPLFVLGGGSNIVVSDQGFPGLVVRIAITGIVEEARSGKVSLTAAAGEDWDAFVAWAVELGLAGIECLSGIPGTVGGTPIQNVGAYGQEVSETIRTVRAWDRRSGCVVKLSHEECGFSYRQSIFNTVERERYVVLSVEFELTPGGAPALRYADVKSHFAGRSEPPSLAGVREAVRTIRARKAMLIVPGDPDCRSAGSFFKNPIVDETVFREIAARSLAPVPHYPASGDAGRVKMAAAWLIEQAGFRKGHGHGPVGISSRHTLALVNRGGASAAELLALMREIQAGVRERFGIELLPEPLFIGF